jgi:hypothetical protein
MIAANGEGFPKPGNEYQERAAEIGEILFSANLQRHMHKSKSLMYQESGFW